MEKSKKTHTSLSTFYCITFCTVEFSARRMQLISLFLGGETCTYVFLAWLSLQKRQEILSHWMEPGHELQCRVSVFTLIMWFSFVFCQTVFNTHPLPVQKNSELGWIQCTKFRKVFLFSLFVVKFWWWLWFKWCCIVVWQTKCECLCTIISYHC